jgi:ATP-dependent DNA helicase RecG
MDGTQQSGTPLQLHIADLNHDGQLLMQARSVASDVLDKDPTLSAPENEVLRIRQNVIFNKEQNWSRIS